MKLKSWKELPEGAVIPGSPNSGEFKTGDWRTQKPIIDFNKCTHCHLCWLYCPDTSVLTENGKITGFDYDHCKGCGICAEVCPPRIKAITMVKEEI